MRSYSSMMRSDNMVSNAEMDASVDDSAAKGYEDDFM